MQHNDMLLVGVLSMEYEGDHHQVTGIHLQAYGQCNMLLLNCIWYLRLASTHSIVLYLKLYLRNHVHPNNTHPHTHIQRKHTHKHTHTCSSTTLNRSRFPGCLDRFHKQPPLQYSTVCTRPRSSSCVCVCVCV